MTETQKDSREDHLSRCSDSVKALREIVLGFGFSQRGNQQAPCHPAQISLPMDGRNRDFSDRSNVFRSPLFFHMITSEALPPQNVL